ncbi:hypothetical protein HanIR_Chr04g0165381 [Helianthus annuus]|nr:hypothetical protein HanIR_Chr04g0165381 [Helianthus annuus]
MQPEVELQQSHFQMFSTNEEDMWSDEYDEESPLRARANDRGKFPLNGPNVHEGYLKPCWQHETINIFEKYSLVTL